MPETAEQDFQPIQFVAIVNPDVDGGKPVYRVYDPLDILAGGKMLHYSVSNVAEDRFPDRVKRALEGKPIFMTSFRRPPVIGNTKKLDRLLNWYAPLHNLSKDAALAKCLAHVQYDLWLWKRPKYHCTQKGPASKYKLELREVRIVKFPEGV